jgi:antitoxin component YwqK of YwqJK toxin-antitoxin module
MSCNQEQKLLVQQDKKVLNVSKTIQIPSIEINRVDISLSLENGVLKFKNAPFSGIVNEYYVDETIKSKSQYYQGRREGYYKGWYENGNRWFERIYAAGLKIGIHFGWYADNQSKFEYHFNNQGAYEGPVKEWHSNGILAKHFNFVNGKEDGSQRMWKPNGNIRANFFTVNSERHGLIGLKNCVSVMSDIDLKK